MTTAAPAPVAARRPSPILVSMTAFLNYVLAGGRPKMTAAKAAKTGDAFDFYGPLRDAIVGSMLHTLVLDDFIAGLENESQRRHFPALAGAWTAFVRKAKVARAFAAPVGLLRSAPTPGTGIVVEVNPTIGLITEAGETLFVKLWCRTEAPDARRIEATLQLLHDTFPVAKTTTTMALLDLRRGVLHSLQKPRAKVSALLAAEACSLAVAVV